MFIRVKDKVRLVVKNILFTKKIPNAFTQKIKETFEKNIQNVIIKYKF